MALNITARIHTTGPKIPGPHGRRCYRCRHAPNWQQRAYTKLTPIVVSVFQTVWQDRRLPSIITSKLAGIPSVVDTLRRAPESETSRATHSSFGVFSLITIWAVFNTRLRLITLCSTDGIATLYICSRPKQRRSAIKRQRANQSHPSGFISAAARSARAGSLTRIA